MSSDPTPPAEKTEPADDAYVAELENVLGTLADNQLIDVRRIIARVRQQSQQIAELQAKHAQDVVNLVKMGSAEVGALQAKLAAAEAELAKTRQQAVQEPVTEKPFTIEE